MLHTDGLFYERHIQRHRAYYKHGEHLPQADKTDYRFAGNGCKSKNGNALDALLND